MAKTISVWTNYGDHAESHSVNENEVLSASPIACAVADAWATIRGFAGFPQARAKGDNGPHQNEGITSWIINRMVDLRKSLDALEAATRESPLRKAKLPK